MTKHGKARSRKGSESKPGSQLVSRAAKGGPRHVSAQFRHTTEMHTQSVLERNDLDELMAMADLADKDWVAERGQVIVISSGVVDHLADEAAIAERKAAEERNLSRLKLPRRPAWDSNTTPDMLDSQERSAFLIWRRSMATMEEEEKLVLTPFEKNLEVWRQLWRVLERSDIVVQVVDARDPLLYRSEDLELFCREINESKASFILLNKADLLPESVRRLWADFFDKKGIAHGFFSAFLTTEEQKLLKHNATETDTDLEEMRAERRETKEADRERELAAAEAEGPEAEEAYAQKQRVELLDGDELVELFEHRAKLAIEAAGPDDPRRADFTRRYNIGLVGFPNVGKSSTINAIFGSKKTAVGPTPGKTRHFQTLNISDSVCLVDCPGLVMPKFANSKPDMVAAGVIPIDKLTDIRSPVGLVTERVGRPQLETLYSLRLPPPQAHEPADTPPTARVVLKNMALLKGWTVGSGLPDEVRAGRQILRDYTAGKLIYCVLPPDSEMYAYVPGMTPEPGVSTSAQAKRAGSSEAEDSEGGMEKIEEDEGEDSEEEGEEGEDEFDVDGEVGVASSSHAGAKLPAGVILPKPRPPHPSALVLDAADLDVLECMAATAPLVKKANKRPDYKMNKKAARTKGDRGEDKSFGSFDGAALSTGKKGGLVRVTGYI